MLNKSMRANYEEYGVEKYYALVGSSYRNPHFPAVRQSIFAWLDAWWLNEGVNLPSRTAVKILDMAAGSGEATVCVKEWWTTRQQGSNPQTVPAMPAPIPQRIPVVPTSTRPAFIPPSKAGRPLVSATPSVTLSGNSPYPAILATDPYTVQAYNGRTGLVCYPLSFEDLASGAMPFESTRDESAEDGRDSEEKDTSNAILDMVICSFALHLVDSPSQLFALLWELSTKARWLMVISPHKKPEIKDSWGWDHWDVGTWARATATSPFGILKDRVHCRVFRSCNSSEE